MIANIIDTKGTKGFRGIIEYSEKKNEGIFYNNLVSEEPNYVISYLESFKPNRKDFKNIYFHVSLSFSKEEDFLFKNKNNEQILDNILKDYMEGMGYSQQPYIGYIHKDKNHYHIHIISTRVDSNGKKISDSLEQRKSQKISTIIEEKYNLLKVDRTSKKIKENIQYKEGLMQRVSDIINKFNSVSKNIEAKFIRNNIIFFEKEGGKYKGKILGSDILNFNKIRFTRKEKNIENKDIHLKIEKNVRSNLEFALTFAKNKEELSKFLEKREITTNVRSDVRGDYGYTFEKNDVKIKLSDLKLNVKDLEGNFRRNENIYNIKQEIIKSIYKSTNVLSFMDNLGKLDIKITTNDEGKCSFSKGDFMIEGNNLNIKENNLGNKIGIENAIQIINIEQEIIKSIYKSTNVLSFVDNLGKLDIKITTNDEGKCYFSKGDFMIEGNNLNIKENNLGDKVGIENAIQSTNSTDINKYNNNPFDNNNIVKIRKSNILDEDEDEDENKIKRKKKRF